MSIAKGNTGIRLRRCRLLLLLVFVAVGASCQTANRSGQVAGTVKDSNGQLIQGATVFLSVEGQTGTFKSTITDANGRYAITDLPFGAYRLSVSAPGFATQEPKSITIQTPAETVDFTVVSLAGKQGAFGLSAQNSEPGKSKPPIFTAAGIEGTTAPTGYSTGLSREETSVVMHSVDNLDHELLSGFVPEQGAQNCSQEPELLKAVENKPRAFGPNHALGVFYLGHGEFTRSIQFLKAANEASPSDVLNTRALALAYLGAKQNSGAVALLEKSVNQAKPDPALLRLLAIAYQEMGNPQKSVAAYEQSAQLDLGIQNQFDCGIGLIGAGAPAEAAELFAAATASHPQSARLWMGLGVAQDLQQKKLDAIHSLLRAIDVDPEYLPSYSFLAGLADAAPESEAQIRRRLAMLVVTHPESAAAHYDYALALWKQNATNPGSASVAEVKSQLELALAKEPQMARAHFQLGIVYSDTGDYRNAESELQQAVKLEPYNAGAHYRLAQVYRRNGKSQLASAEIKEFLALRGVPGRDENSPETDLQQLGSHLSQQLRRAAPCGDPSR